MSSEYLNLHGLSFLHVALSSVVVGDVIFVVVVIVEVIELVVVVVFVVVETEVVVVVVVVVDVVEVYVVVEVFVVIVVAEVVMSDLYQQSAEEGAFVSNFIHFLSPVRT